MANRIKIKDTNFEEITEIFRYASNKAALKILEIYQSENVEAKKKQDSSPVTKADIESNRIIIETLNKELKFLNVVSEESECNYNNDIHEFVLVDPLDGTKEFLNKNGEFTVNIALIQNYNPKLGVIDAPVLETQYFSNGFESYKVVDNKISKIYSSESNKLIIVCSRSHLDQKTQSFMDQIKMEKEIIKKGSSLKLCMIAESQANLYVRYGKTMEWDIAAGHAILKTANAEILELDKEKSIEFIYGKQKFVNGSFIAFSKSIDYDLIEKAINTI